MCTRTEASLTVISADNSSDVVHSRHDCPCLHCLIRKSSNEGTPNSTEVYRILTRKESRLVSSVVMQKSGH